MAITAAVDPKLATGDIQSYKMAASTTIYAGTLVAMDSSGNAVEVTVASSLLIVGVALETATCGATAGAVSVRVKRSGTIERVTATMAQTDIGKACYAAADNQVTPTSTGATKCGTYAEMITTTLCRINLIPTG